MIIKRAIKQIHVFEVKTLGILSAKEKIPMTSGEGRCHECNLHILKDMAKNGKTTSSQVASTASKILKDGRYSSSSKSVAGSALSQKTGKRSK